MEVAYIMAYIEYKIYPDDPDATEKERLKAYFGIFSIWGSLGAVIYFIYSMFFLYTALQIRNFIYSTVFVIIMAIIDFFLLFQYRKNKKEIAKRYFLFFFGGLLCLACLIGIFASIYFLCHDESWILLFILSLLCIVIIVALTFFIYSKMKDLKFCKIRLFTEKNYTSTVESTSYIYCHRCGKKTLAESTICPSCGIKLK